MEIHSIGTEEFPFVSTIRGVTTANPDEFVSLPSGEKSNTSVLGNLEVNATENQTDIGLFGNVGPIERPEDDSPIGTINNLLLYNVMITSTSAGGTRPNHDNFVTSAPYESNHIGILAGHAQYTTISNISVYYSGSNGNPNVKAFNVHNGAGHPAAPKYTTASGIIGYYRDLSLGDGGLPVTSDGKQDFGGETSGLGLGIVNANDIWKFMEDKTSVGKPAPNAEYSIQETFGPELYGISNVNKDYFQLGVFTFAHSAQTTEDDSIVKLWETEDNEWKVSTGGNYTHEAVTQNIVARSYNLTQITNHQMKNPSTPQMIHQLTDELANTNKYRYMLTVEDGGKNYALVRNGATAVPKEINTANFIIPESELEYYTFTPYSQQIQNSNVPPYGTYGYQLTGQLTGLLNNDRDRLHFNEASSPNNTVMQYLGYGKNITRDGTIKEIPRPLRIYYDFSTGTLSPTSFMASSSAATTKEGVRLVAVANNLPVNVNGTRPDATDYETFFLQRRTSEIASQTAYTSYSAANGFRVENYHMFNNVLRSAIARFKLWAVDVSNPQVADYDKEIYTPIVNGNLKTYDMRENVLYYIGNATSNNNSLRYKYEYRSLPDLNWQDNSGKRISSLNNAIKMAAPTSYYFINTTFWGVVEGIPNPGGSGTIDVPEGSIGFTVQDGPAGSPKAKIRVIVATDPAQDLNQTIMVSRFGSGTNQKSNRTIVANLPLPPVPGPNHSGTIPISVVDGGITYNNIYPNQNVLLVAYVFEVDVQTVPITYFLEASQGSANFVYLSSDRISSEDNNTFHENEIGMKQLDNIDLVHDTPEGVIATVNHPDYVRSLTAPYFGITRNPDRIDDSDPTIDALIISIITSYDFTYAINRAYNISDEKYYTYISIFVTAPSDVTGDTDAIIKVIMANYNFNFNEGASTSDVVVLTINSKVVNWSIL